MLTTPLPSIAAKQLVNPHSFWELRYVNYKRIEHDSLPARCYTNSFWFCLFRTWRFSSQLRMRFVRHENKILEKMLTLRCVCRHPVNESVCTVQMLSQGERSHRLWQVMIWLLHRLNFNHKEPISSFVHRSWIFHCISIFIIYYCFHVVNCYR